MCTYIPMCVYIYIYIYMYISASAKSELGEAIRAEVRRRRGVTLGGARRKALRA